MGIETVLDTNEGFLGVMNPERRAEALKLSIEELAARLEERLTAQASLSQHLSKLLELAEESLPNDTESDGTAATLWACKRLAREADDALCMFGGYFEALIVRATEAAHG